MSAKAAPLRALGNRTSDQRATPFENEDDDEDENVEGRRRERRSLARPAHPKNSTNHAYFCGIGSFWRLA
jgi:hypothetical protein